ncbi:MAG: VWA domain-containing protein [Gammaproteobacteria bacterium]|jgi:Ca-activated chloride channel family protein|nr:VWA domain-containing protein [Gammaproteobacteria bacterium]MBP6052930.1 VWA domain-containing protein [Pseudomonadales bacterium]MBK6581954.1 VWA domain-containing protein [Gammaproteobacteria bacterium]MBK7170372.1 VWA domain-containing protein [Gammaproteobacteria bacterium]MBK7521783.1 VWA domain-containing protein [Gammaproteobacteria bacterium]
MSGLPGDFHFIRPLWLLLAPVAVALWWLWRREADPLRGWRRQLAPELLEALVVGHSRRQHWQGGSLLVAWLLGVVAVAGPTWQLEPSPFADDATPLMLLLKADASMEQSDLEPSRLERAWLKIADLAAARRGQPLGLIAYAGSAHLVLPPTRDTAIVASMAAEVSPQIMPEPGDRLDRALALAQRVLAQGARGGSIVVLADAVDTDSALLEAAGTERSIAVQFLALNLPGSSEDQSLRAAARILSGHVEAFAIEGDDVAALVRRAARTPDTLRGEQGGQWQEAGYWLVPPLALLMLAAFRRRERAEAAT